MNRSFWKLLAASAIIAAPLLFAPRSGAQKKEAAKIEVVREDWAARPIAKGQLLVTLHDGVRVEDLKPIFERFDAKYEIIERIDSLNHYTLSTDHNRLPELKQRLNNHPYVASASYNGVSQLSRVFNDPIFKKPNGMPEDKDNWNLYRINAPDAWDITTGGTVVAVIDSGAVLDHEDLVGRITNPHSFATGSAEMQAGMRKENLGEKKYSHFDIRNHGTHVAVTISGNADNGAGTVGVAPNSRIMPLQAITYRHLYPDEDAGLLRGFDGAVNQAIAMAMERRASVINMSLGPTDPELKKAWHAAKTDPERNDIANQYLAKAEDALRAVAPILDRVNRAGVIVVVAAGNDGIPAAFNYWCLSRRTISVAATTREDKRADFSNHGEFTTVSAPGKEIWSGFAEEGKPYAYLQGTSMAAPHATGVVSLMQTIDPGLKLADAADILIKTGRPLTTDLPIGPLINAKLAIEETQRRREKNIRMPETPPLIPDPGINPTLPQLPKDGVDILRQPAPWRNPNIQRIIRLWLAFAIARPPAGGQANLVWFFNMNGQIVNNNTVLVVPRPLWFQFNFQWLLQNADQLDSVNMGTLNEFLVGTLRQGRFDPAPTRVPENVRPKKEEAKPQAKAPLDPTLDKTKWTGKNKKGDQLDFEFHKGKLTITHNGKKDTYIPKFNTYVEPIRVDLYPEHGGNPIRGLIDVKNLHEISIVTDFTNKRPSKIQDGDNHFALKHGEAPVATAKAEPAKPKVAKPRPKAIGFQDGDAKKVGPNFSSVISDGTQFCAADVANFAGHTKSAGPRTGIASRDIDVARGNGHHWVVRRFTEPAGPRQYLAKFAKTEFAGLKVVARQIERDFIKQTIEVGGQSIHTYAFVHQDDFLVTFSLFEGRRGHDFSAESRRIAEATKKLIDERFPVE